MNISKFFKDLFRKRKFSKVVLADRSTVSPQKDTITIIRKGNNYVWAKFYCPCGCKTEIMLSLNPSIMPYWGIKLEGPEDNLKVSFSPSVNLTGYKCKSHFFIKENCIKWV